MLKTSTLLVCMVIYLVACRAITSGSVYGSAVNTGGIARATVAVKTAGRVFLTSGRRTNRSVRDLPNSE